MRRYASKDASPERGVDLVGIPHRLEKGADKRVGFISGASAGKNVGH